MQTNIRFLGQDFIFSSDIKEYIAASELANEIHTTLKRKFISKLNHSSASFLGAGSLDDDIRVQTDRFIQRLCRNGIFTHTIDEYITANPAYSIIDEINNAACQACCSFLAEEIENFQNGMEIAETAALSQITGSGVSVFTDSMLTLAVTSAMECAILKDQYNKADAQYKRNIQNISDSGERTRIAKETEYVKSTYIPQMDKVLYLFSYSLLDKYLQDMISEGKFDSAALENVDYKKSTGILGNLKHINDTEGEIICIKQAFIACPFNYSVYLYAASTSSFDYDTYKSACFFGVENQFLYDLKKKIHFSNNDKLFESIKALNPFISAYSICTKTDRTTALKALTKSFHDEIVKKYKDMIRMSTSNHDIEDVLKSMKRKPIDETGVKSCVTNMVKSIVSAANFDTLLNECGYSELLAEISSLCKDMVFSSKKEVDDFLILRISDGMNKIVTQEQVKMQEEQKAAEVNHVLTQKKNHTIRRANAIIFSILLLLPIIVSIVASAVFVEDIKKVTESHISDVVEEAQSMLGTKLDFTIDSIEIQKSGETTLTATGKITFYGISKTDYEKCIFINTSLDWIRHNFRKQLLLDKYNNLWFEFEVHIIDESGIDSIVEHPFFIGEEKPILVFENHEGFYILYYAAIVIVFLYIRKKYQLDKK